METALIVLTGICLFLCFITMMWGLGRRIDRRSDTPPMLATIALLVLAIAFGVASMLV
jgi:hypothetical protein